MPQPTSNPNSGRGSENWRQTMCTMETNQHLDHEWIRASRKDGISLRNEKKAKKEAEQYLVHADSARDSSPLTARTTLCYVTKHRPPVGGIPSSRMEEIHMVKTQGYNQMLSVSPIQFSLL